MRGAPQNYTFVFVLTAEINYYHTQQTYGFVIKYWVMAAIAPYMTLAIKRYDEWTASNGIKTRIIIKRYFQFCRCVRGFPTKHFLSIVHSSACFITYCKFLFSPVFVVCWLFVCLFRCIIVFLSCCFYHECYKRQVGIDNILTFSYVTIWNEK